MVEFGEVISSHTIKKWTLLKNYLEKYTLIMSNKFWNRFFYIDAFAGKGKYDNYDGSPIIALNIKYPFTDYVFIEINLEYIRELKANIEKLSPRKAEICRTYPLNSEKEVDIQISYKNTNVNSYLQEHLSDIVPEGIPCFIFLDPEGIIGLDRKTLEVCSKKHRVELLINFPIYGVIRNVDILLPQNEELITNLYGSEKWKEIRMKIDRREERLAELYIEGLKEFFKYLPYTIITNERNTPIYYLIFATNNYTGFKIMNGAMQFGQRKITSFFKKR